MRRIMFALLVPLITVVAPLAPPVSAGASQPRSSHQPRQSVALVRHHPNPAATAALHVLDAAAASVRVSIAELRAEWQHVAVCEVGGNWAMTGSAYSGIGFLNATWSEYGGSKYAPLAGQATRDQQIVIGMKVTNGWVPDQSGCSPGGW